MVGGGPSGPDYFCAIQGRGSNVIHCRKDGTWSGSFHLCQEMQGQCSAPDQLNSNLKLQCPEGYAIGMEARGGGIGRASFQELRPCPLGN